MRRCAGLNTHDTGRQLLEERQDMGLLGTPSAPQVAVNAAGRPYDPTTGTITFDSAFSAAISVGDTFSATFINEGVTEATISGTPLPNSVNAPMSDEKWSKANSPAW